MQKNQQILDEIREYVSKEDNRIIKLTDYPKYTDDWRFGITDDVNGVRAYQRVEFRFPPEPEPKEFECPTIQVAEAVARLLECGGMKKDRDFKNQIYSEKWDKIYVYIWKAIA